MRSARVDPTDDPASRSYAFVMAVTDGTRRLREAMVQQQIAARGVRDRRVLGAMARVPRHAFVPAELGNLAYADRPLPIGDDQTISQPYVVAAMTELAHLRPGSRVLEIGTGSGYQTAVLAELGAEVYSIEIVEPIAVRVRALLEQLGYGDRIHLRTCDGYAGWPEVAPFHSILVTAAPPEIPRPLLAQLRVGGRMVVPVGPEGGKQELYVVTRIGDDVFERDDAFPVAFVPMTGEAQSQLQRES
jgi:protein-L-isoaspartate(D-aspartate) O-methyltransferase